MQDQDLKTITETEVETQTRLVDVKTMSKLLGVKPSWLYSRTRLKGSDFPFYCLGKYRKFDPAAVFAYLNFKRVNQNRGEI